jgi:hypothetical protein
VEWRNVHFHVLALDGVYVRKACKGALVFHPLPIVISTRATGTWSSGSALTESVAAPVVSEKSLDSKRPMSR